MAESIEGWTAMLKQLKKVRKMARLRREEGKSNWSQNLRNDILGVRFGTKSIDGVSQSERLANNIIQQVKWRISLLEGKEKIPPEEIIETDTEILTLPDVLKMVPLSKTTLWRLEKSGHFPKRSRLGLRRAAWRRSDIANWINGLGRAS